MNLMDDVQQTSNTNWPPKATNASAYPNQSVDATLAGRGHQQGAHIDYLERQMQEVADQHGASISEIQQFFIFRDDDAVMSFLYDHREVPHLLLQAVPFLNRYFGRDKILSLNIDSDEAGSRILYGIVAWKGSASAARLALNDFDDNWWMAHALQACGRLTFTYELV